MSIPQSQHTRLPTEQEYRCPHLLAVALKVSRRLVLYKDVLETPYARLGKLGNLRETMGLAHRDMR